VALGLEAATARLAKLGLRAAMAPGQECDLRHIPSVLAVTSGQSRTPTDTYEHHRRGHAHARRFGPEREGLHSRSNASAEAAHGGGLAVQVTGSTHGAIGRDYIDPA
jgi:hypothetical protein